MDPKLIYIVQSIYCKCGNERRPSGRYCPECHASYMRGWRANRKSVVLARRAEDGAIIPLRVKSFTEKDGVVTVTLEGLDE